MLILFLTVATLASSTKFLTSTRIKKEFYEDYYSTFLSIKDKMSNASCSAYSGSYNGFDYKLTCKPLKTLKNYVPDFGEGDPFGNIGRFTYQLNDVTLTLSRGRFEKSLSYKTVSIVNQ
jgi:hypothetical protein